MDIQITIDGKPAKLKMLKFRAKRLGVLYGNKVDHWFVSGGHWPSDNEINVGKSK